jgi:protein-S-isoprenylcysteine O-methyltransferase Ste14
MKTVGGILFFAFLMSSSGCMTYSSVQRAKGEHNVVTGHYPTEQHPGYYALLPLTVPADIATSPIQLLLYVLLGSSHTPL